jgi:hypothetical protein
MPVRFRLVPSDDAFFGLFDDSAANVAVVYLVLAVASWLDARSRRRL